MPVSYQSALPGMSNPQHIRQSGTQRPLSALNGYPAYAGDLPSLGRPCTNGTQTEQLSRRFTTTWRCGYVPDCLCVGGIGSFRNRFCPSCLFQYSAVTTLHGPINFLIRTRPPVSSGSSLAPRTRTSSPTLATPHDDRF